MPSITNRTVSGICPEAKRYTIWDSKLIGFGVIVRPSGTHSYVFSYRNKHSRKRTLTIGKVGTLAPDQARRLAEEARWSVLNGSDPMERKSDPRMRMTVGQLLDQYIESADFTAKAESTRYTDLGRIERHLRPLLGSTPLAELDFARAEKVHKAIVEGRTAQERSGTRLRGRVSVRGGAGTARAAIRLLSAILKWGFRMNVTPQSAIDAVRHVKIGRDAVRSTILEDPDQYVRLWATLDRLTDASNLSVGETLIRPQVADAIKVIALTGARKGEITGLRWKHVDLDKGVIRLPPDLHKSGRRTGDDRVIGLPKLAIEIVRRQGIPIPDDFVFRSTKPGSEITLSKAWRMVRRSAGLPDGIGLHGLRHSLASHMAMRGAEAAEIMTALGHRDISSTQRYIHWAKDQRQELAEKAASGITSILGS